MTQFCKVLSIHTGQPVSDGAGVKVTRVFGGQGVERFDPSTSPTERSPSKSPPHHKYSPGKRK